MSTIGADASPPTADDPEMQADEIAARAEVGLFGERQEAGQWWDAAGRVVYGVGFAVDAYGRKAVDRQALKAGAVLIYGMDGVRALGEPMYDQLRVRRALDYGKLLRSVVELARAGLPLGMPLQTLLSIDKISQDPAFVSLDRPGAELAGAWGMAGGTIGVVEVIAVAVWRKSLADVAKNRKNIHKLVESLGVLIEGVGRRHQNSALIFAGSLITMANFAFATAMDEWQRPLGNKVVRLLYSLGTAGLAAGAAGVTGQTWLASVDRDYPAPGKVMAQRKQLKESGTYSIVAAASGIFAGITKAAQLRSSRVVTGPPAVALRSMEPDTGGGWTAQPSVGTSSSPAAVGHGAAPLRAVGGSNSIRSTRSR